MIAGSAFLFGLVVVVVVVWGFVGLKFLLK